MTTDSHHLNTLPPGLEGDLEGLGRPPAGPPPSSTDYSLVAAVGAQVDGPVSVGRHALNAWVESGAIAPGQVKPVEDALIELHRLSQNCQLLARVAEGRWQQTHAQLNLDSVIKHALDEQLDKNHKNQQDANPDRTLNGMNNALEKPRQGDLITAKDKLIHELGLEPVMKSLHDERDADVLAA